MTKNRLYQPYLNEIKAAVSQYNQDGFINEGRNFSGIGSVTASYSTNIILDETSGIQKLADYMGVRQVDQSELGNHPDFVNIKMTKKPEFHYIISMFIDIKNSTGLFKKYKHYDIFKVTNTIQAAAIHTIKIFGGHVQRLQGDGVFAYFGRKGLSKEDATNAALNAAAFFSYFVKHELPEVFNEDGVDKIYTRIGIDFGDDKDVMWAVFGSDHCNELTTLSLHTSLAPKMQANAQSNGIITGQNVVDRVPQHLNFFSVLKKDNGQVDFIWEDSGKSFYYRQYTFDWHKFLKQYPFIKSDSEGGLLMLSMEELNEQLRIKQLRKEVAKTNVTRNLDNQGKTTNANTPIQSAPHKFYSGK